MSNTGEPHDEMSLASLVGRVEKARSSLTPRPKSQEDASDDGSANIIPSMGNVGNPAKPPLPPNSQSLARSGSHASMPRDASVGSFTAAYFPPEPTPQPEVEVSMLPYFRDPNESKPPPTEMAILGVPDDVSTIANDTLNGSVTGSMFNFWRKGGVATPERQQNTNTRGEELPAGFGGTIQIPSGAKDRDLPPMQVNTSPKWSGKKYFYAAMLAVFLLAAIGALSYGFLKVRDLNTLSAPVDENTDRDFTFTLRPTQMGTAAPGAAPTLAPIQPGRPTIPTRTPTGQPSRRPTMTPSLVPTISASTSLLQILGEISPSIVANVETEGTKQKEAFDWLVNDPEYFTYNDKKIVQRFALAMFSLEIASSRRRLSDRRLNEALETWMKYTDECTWFTSWYENRVACDATGTFKFLVLRNIGLDGTIPSELALLTRLDTLVLSDNSIQGTIPEELGNWTSLEHFEVNSNEIGGSIPSTLGQMEALIVLDLGSNELTGQIPNELGNLQNSQTLKLNSNQLSGSIPEGISNMETLVHLDLSSNDDLTGTVPPMDRLNLLKEVKLADTDLNGAMPVDLCSFELDILEADCEDIFCTCCTNCESVGTPSPTSPTVSPTSFPTISPAPTTSSPTPIPTPFPTPEPTPEQCWDSIQTTKTCFTVGEAINMNFKNCLPVGNDWIGVYESSTLAYELYNPMMWEYGCGSQGCYGAIMDGFLSFDGRSGGTETWPLKKGTYKAWMFRDGSATGPYYAYAATETFTIADSC